jgi:hypothetical protein
LRRRQHLFLLVSWKLMGGKGFISNRAITPKFKILVGTPKNLKKKTVGER